MSTAEGRHPSALAAAARIVPPVLAVLAIALVVVLAWQLRGLLIMVFVAALVAAALHDPSAWLERRGLPRLLAVIVPYLLIGAILTGVVILIVPPLIDQAAALIADLPSIADALLTTVVGVVDRFVGDGTGDAVIEQLTDELRDLVPGIGTLTRLPLTLFEALIGIGTVLFLSLLLLLERDDARRWILRFVDEGDRDVVAGLGRDVFVKLGAYVRGQALVMTAVGLATTIGMLVLGVPFALPLGLLAFLAELIPLVGPFIAAGPILVVAFVEGPTTGLLMLAWLLIVQQAEGWILTPFIQGKVLSLSPVVVLVAVFAGGSLAGIVGAVIAVPLVAALDVLIRDVVLPLRQGRPVRSDGADVDDSRDTDGEATSGRTGAAA